LGRWQACPRVERSLSRKLREAPFFYGIYTIQLVAGAAVALLPGNAVNLVINAQQCRAELYHR
jgi:hypothetical protein